MATEIPDDILLFGGFALMHALYSISDVAAGELLVPFVIVESEGQQDVIRFEADTQEEAVANAKRHLESIDGTVNLWAFARENTLRQNEKLPSSVASVDIGRVGLTTDISIVQPFHPNNGKDEFRLLSGAFVAINGASVDDSDNVTLVNLVREGVGYHPKATLWSNWSEG